MFELSLWNTVAEIFISLYLYDRNFQLISILTTDVIISSELQSWIYNIKDPFFLLTYIIIIMWLDVQKPSFLAPELKFNL